MKQMTILSNKKTLNDPWTENEQLFFSMDKLCNFKYYYIEFNFNEIFKKYKKFQLFTNLAVELRTK